MSVRLAFPFILHLCYSYLLKRSAVRLRYTGAKGERRRERRLCSLRKRDGEQTQEQQLVA